MAKSYSSSVDVHHINRKCGVTNELINNKHLEMVSLTVGVEASTLADGIPVPDVLPPASSKGVGPV